MYVYLIVRCMSTHTHTHTCACIMFCHTNHNTAHGRTHLHTKTEMRMKQSMYSHHSQMVWMLGCVCVYIHIHCVLSWSLTLSCLNMYIIQDRYNSLQFLVQGQIYTSPRGTSSLWDYRPKRHSEGMSDHSHPSQTSCLQIVASGTRHIQGIHHRQQGEGQWLNPVYMVNAWVQCCIRLWVCTHHCWVWLTSALWNTSAPCSNSTSTTGRCPLLAAYITGVADYRKRAITII